MAVRQRVFLLLASMILAAFAPRPAAQPASPPVLLSDVVVDEGQGTPDPACVARCGATRDREIAGAENLLKTRGFYALFETNCTEEKGQPLCTALRQDCREACAPKYETKCMAACDAPFQNCCYSNGVAMAKTIYDQCVSQCPMSKAAALGGGAAPAAAASVGKGTTLDKKSEWDKMLKTASTMLEALGPGIDGLDLDRFNDLRRMLAFTQVSARLGEMDGQYAVVSGGNGRLWVILASGKQVEIDESLCESVRGRNEGPDSMAKAMAAGDMLKKAAGLSNEDIGKIFSAIEVAEIDGFKPGDFLTFPKNGKWPPEIAKKYSASSEHSSIRGSINGGGDFI
jgi:hypothetical protein